MAANPNVSVILPQDGVRYGDQSYWAQVPQQTNAGLDLCKAPQAGAFVALTVYPNFNKLGYVTVREDNSGTKYRILLTDHPDGG
jgi:hypothetical protein